MAALEYRGGSVKDMEASSEVKDVVAAEGRQVGAGSPRNGRRISVAEKSLQRWQATDSRRTLICRSLQSAGINIHHIHETSDPLIWGLFVQLPQSMAEMFATRREILVWGTFRSDATFETLQDAFDLLGHDQVRLSRDILIVFCANSSIAQELNNAAKDVETAVAVLTEAALYNCRPQGSTELVDLLRPNLYSRDLYDLKPPVTRSRDFFGRNSILDSLRRDVRSGQSHVGIFGLRKIGKTSLVNRLGSALRSQGNVTVAHIDLQRVVAINPSASYVLWHIGEALFDDNRRFQRNSQRRLFGLHAVYTDIPNPEQVWELFDHDIRLLMLAQSGSIVIMLDEIERIFPADGSSVWAKDFVRLWQLLRGIDQETPGRMKFVISGTNPRCVEDHAVFGVDNPIYNYFKVLYLGPLEQPEGVELLSTYGRRMGLNWSANAMRRALEDTGGHPAILRTYASMMHQKFTPRVKPVVPNVDDARDIAHDFLVQEGPLLAQIVAILEDQYQDEFEILNTLALGRVNEFRELAREFPDDMAHLIGYGLCGEPTQATRLHIQLLQTYLQQRERVHASRAGDNSADLIGILVDDEYEVLSLVSGSGGYADVYKAARQGPASNVVSGYAAIKVLRFGKLSILEREVEALQAMNHPNIVKVLGSGRLPDGRVYLAMEYLEGQTLRSYCAASARPSEGRLLSWAVSLLDALFHMHPRTREIRAMRANRVGDEETLQDLLEARYGYVHRDIKPENIIVTPRGPVLVDFNISVKASSPVLTVSATPGYLPNPPVGGSWSPIIDLYQLGLTLLQAAAGAEFTGDNIGDLLAMAADVCGQRTMAILTGLLSATSSGYQTAYTAHRAAVAALDSI
jgi:serine/threonine-protein kinase